MATISNTPRPGYVWDSADNVWYPIGVGAHQHTNAADTPAVMPYSTYAAAGKNKIINGDFAINQRVFTSNTTSGYMFDRWTNYLSGGTVTWSAQTFTPGAAPVSGYESKNYLQCAVTSQTLGSSAALLIQAIEDVRTLAGQTATISFWAKASSGTPKIAIELEQGFGSGGSPSSNVFTAVAQPTISTSWTRYSTTVTVPSISGKTIGTSSGYLALGFWLSAGSDFNSRTNSLGIQNNTFQIWGVQIEASSNVTAFQTATGTLQGELAACQRYYTTSIPTGFTITDFSGMNPGSSSAIAWCSPGSSNDAFTTIQYPVPMRAAPTFNIYSAGNRTSGSIRDAVTGSDITVSNYSVQAGNNKGFNYMAGMSATTGRPYSFQWTASAEL